MIRPGSIQSFSRHGNAVVFQCEVGVLRLEAYRANIIHVAFFPGEPAELPMWGFVATPDAVDLEVETSAQTIHLSTDRMIVDVARDSGQVTIRSAAGEVLLRSQDCALEPATVSGEATHHLHLAFDASDDEAYYGLGQHQLGWMDHRGKEVRLWHDYEAEGGEIVAIPFLVTNRGYGFVLDNPSRVKVTCGDAGRTTWFAEVADAVSFFVIAGETVDEIYEGYRFLTGATPLPPIAAVGYIQCKQRYKTRDELMKVAQTYRDRGYPCDILVVDWFHWKTLGDLDLDEKFWADADSMNRQLAEMGYQTMISCWPRFMKDSKHFDTLEANGWFMKQTGGQTIYGTPKDQRGALIDTTNPEAAEWYWNTIRDSYAAKGFTSWWLDEDEPDICPHEHFLHAGSGARVHNIYPLTHTRAIYEGHRRDLPGRCLILSRSAYHGAQRNGTTFWSSDIHPTWDVFRRQIPTGLNFCASGFAWWSSDIGGWQPLPDEPSEDESYRELLIETDQSKKAVGAHVNYPELYLRWFQFGAFCPTFRAHGTRSENEVWSFGPKAETILVKYLKLRYRLLPYIYSLARETHVTGAPFMRALFMDFPDDDAVRDIKNEYMFGPAFLVAPVVEKGARRRKVYLPAGTMWYDYWTGEKHPGGQTLRVEAPLDTLPLFVREGSIIPHGEVIQHTGEKQTSIELRVYEGADCNFALYRDDGMTYAYEHGDYTLVRISWDDEAKTIHIDGDNERLFGGSQSEWLMRINGELS